MSELQTMSPSRPRDAGNKFGPAQGLENLWRQGQRPDVQEMIKRVSFHVDPEAERAGLDKMTSILKIHLKDGRILSGRAEFAKGSPANPMSYQEVADKFRGCAEFAKWPTAKTESVIAAVKSLETLSDVGTLSAALTS